MGNFVYTVSTRHPSHLGGALSYLEIVALRQAFKYQCYFFCKDFAQLRNNRISLHYLYNSYPSW